MRYFGPEYCGIFVRSGKILEELSPLMETWNRFSSLQGKRKLQATYQRSYRGNEIPSFACSCYWDMNTWLQKESQLSGSPSLMNTCLKTKECPFVKLLFCAVAIPTLHTNAFPFYSWENFTKNCWEVKAKTRRKRNNQFPWFTSFNVKIHALSGKDLLEAGEAA